MKPSGECGAQGYTPPTYGVAKKDVSEQNENGKSLGRNIFTTSPMPYTTKPATTPQEKSLHDRSATISEQQVSPQINECQTNYSVDGSCHSFLSSLNSMGDTGNQFNILFVPKDGGSPISIADFQKSGNEEILKNYQEQISKISQNKESISYGLMQNMIKTQQEIASIVNQQFMSEQMTGQISQSMGMLLESMQNPVVQPMPVNLSYLLGFSGSVIPKQQNNPMMGSGHAMGGQQPLPTWGSYPKMHPQPFNYPMPQQAGFHAMPPPPPQQGMGFRIPFSPYAHHCQQNPAVNLAGQLKQLEGFAQAPMQSLIPRLPKAPSAQIAGSQPQPITININNDKSKKGIEHEASRASNRSRIDSLTEQLKNADEVIIDRLEKIQDLINKRNINSESNNQHQERDDRAEQLVNDIAELKQEVAKLNDQISKSTPLGDLNSDDVIYDKHDTPELAPSYNQKPSDDYDVKDETLYDVETDPPQQETIDPNASMSTANYDTKKEDAQQKANELLRKMIDELLPENVDEKTFEKIKEDISSLKDSLENTYNLKLEDTLTIVDPLEKTYKMLIDKQSKFNHNHELQIKNNEREKDLRSESKELQSKNNDLDKKLIDINKKNKELEEKLQNKIQESQNKIKDLERKMQEIESNNKNLHGENKNLEGKLQTLKANMEQESKKLMDKHQKSNQNLENDIKKLNLQMDNAISNDDSEEKDNKLMDAKNYLVDASTSFNKSRTILISKYPDHEDRINDHINLLIKSCEKMTDHLGHVINSRGEHSRLESMYKQKMNDLGAELKTVRSYKTKR